MFDLNRKLQASAQRSQVRAIDLELRRLEAQEAIEHLSLVRSYVPDSLATISESIKTLLRFKRMTFKAGLIVSMLRDVSSANSESAMRVTLSTDLCDKLALVRKYSTCFATAMSLCSISEFENYGAAVNAEISNAEEALDKCLAGFKDDTDFSNANKNLQELENAIEVLSELYESKKIDSSSARFGEMKHIIAKESILLVRSYMDSAIYLTLDLVSTVLSEISMDEFDSDLAKKSYEGELMGSFRSTAEALIAQGKGMKVLAAKVTAIIEENIQQSKCPNEKIIRLLTQIESVVQNITSYIRNVSFAVSLSLTRDSDGNQKVVFDEIQEIMRNEMDSNPVIASREAGGFFSVCVGIIKTAVTQLGEVLGALSGAQGIESCKYSI